MKSFSDPDVDDDGDDEGEGPLVKLLPIVDVFLVLVVVLFAQARSNPSKLLATVAQHAASASTKDNKVVRVLVAPGAHEVTIDGRRLDIAQLLQQAETKPDTTLLLQPEKGVSLHDFIELLAGLSAKKVSYAINHNP